MGATDQDITELQDQLSAYMERKGLRSTSQRRLVSDIFFRIDGHLSIDDVLARVREHDPKVGYATVYRTMKLLVECGLANERQFDDSVTRFEVAHEDSHHDHLICLECKRIVEFEDDEIERLQEELAERKGFELVSHKHELYGLCADCRRA
ncbi:MAG: transcriptional repressor [Myxococcales bacterium]|jgi:Fur family ferric uptake transcriptional regulator